VSPVKYELGFYNSEHDILHSHCRENLKSSISERCFYLSYCLWIVIRSGSEEDVSTEYIVSIFSGDHYISEEANRRRSLAKTNVSVVSTGLFLSLIVQP
jgi:hypothetical protein